MAKLWHGYWSLFLARFSVRRSNKVRKVCSLVRKGESGGRFRTRRYGGQSKADVFSVKLVPWREA